MKVGTGPSDLDASPPRFSLAFLSTPMRVDEQCRDRNAKPIREAHYGNQRDVDRPGFDLSDLGRVEAHLLGRLLQRPTAVLA